MSERETHRNPSEVDSERSWFDELASRAHNFASRDIFFIILVILILLWAPSYFILHSLSHWYIALVIPAEIITLLLVALLENNNRRSEQALHRKLDAFAVALAAMAAESSSEKVREQADELRASVGLQDRESSEDDEGD